MTVATSFDLGRIAQDLQIRKVQVDAVLHLLEQGCTIPFIARYRRERTGGLPIDALHAIEARFVHQRRIQERRQTLLKNLQLQEKLTDDLSHALLTADTMRRLDDLYLPFKPKKKSLAGPAKERGLEPVAVALWNADPSVADFTELLPTFVNPEKGLNTPEDVHLGVQQILAERLAELAPVREAARKVLWDSGKLVVHRSEKLGEGQGTEYRDYFQFNEPLRHLPPHRILAINRGEKENALKVQVQWPSDTVHAVVRDRLFAEGSPARIAADHPHIELFKSCLPLAVDQVLMPGLEREARRDLTEMAEEHALQVFARNLKRLLLQPPVRGQRVLAIDPGFRSGCQIAVLDEQGCLLEHEVIHPHPQLTRREERRKAKEEKAKPEAATAETPPASESPPLPAAEAPASPPEESPPAPTALAPVAEPVAAPPPPLEPPDPREQAKSRLTELVNKYGIQLLALGSGTACRETEELVSELITEQLPHLAYVIVNEAGASHYSASTIGREEFPDLDTNVRATISIGRRLQDPLSELVKIDPQNIGVGLYQHDIQEKRLHESLETVFQTCVNHVGVDVNSAHVSLLRHVSGLNPLTARAIVEHRKTSGPFRNREQLKQVPGLSEHAYQQAAGFVKVTGSDQPLDRVWIHPDSYPVALQLLSRAGADVAWVADPAHQAELEARLRALNFEQVAQELQGSVPALEEIACELAFPSGDPRDELPQPIFKHGILRFEDLKPGMELRGTVLNVVDFGAFIDVGLKDSGLVHISQVANRFVKSPHDFVAVGDVVTVWVLSVDQERKRVSLTMIRPGSERPPQHHAGGSEATTGSRRPQQPPGEGRGRGRARGQRPQPARGGAAPAQAPADGGQVAASADRPRRGPPPRRQQQYQQHQYQRPAREQPTPKLSEAELQGEQPLRTFAELKALYEAKKPQ
jgi:transcriptional accessory protein Tex/SPT6